MIFFFYLASSPLQTLTLYFSSALPRLPIWQGSKCVDVASLSSRNKAWQSARANPSLLALAPNSGKPPSSKLVTMSGKTCWLSRSFLSSRTFSRQWDSIFFSFLTVWLPLRPVLVSSNACQMPSLGTNWAGPRTRACTNISTAFMGTKTVRSISWQGATSSRAWPLTVLLVSYCK